MLHDQFYLLHSVRRCRKIIAAATLHPLAMTRLRSRAEARCKTPSTSGAVKDADQKEEAPESVGSGRREAGVGGSEEAGGSREIEAGDSGEEAAAGGVKSICSIPQNYPGNYTNYTTQHYQGNCN